MTQVLLTFFFFNEYQIIRAIIKPINIGQICLYYFLDPFTLQSKTSEETKPCILDQV